MRSTPAAPREPGRRLRKLSETLTAFVSDETYAAADEGASQAEAGATQESQAYYG